MAGVFFLNSSIEFDFSDRIWGMTKYPYFREAFVSLLLLGILHAVALNFYLYWSYPHFDNVMHFFGGAVVAFGAIWSFKTRNLLFLVGVFFLVAIGWELFEYYYSIAVWDGQNYAIDTITDLIMGLLGASSVYYYVRSREKNV